MKKSLKFLNVFTLILIISFTIDTFTKISSIVHNLVNNIKILKVGDLIFPLEWNNSSTILFVFFHLILNLFLVYLAFIFREVIISFSKNKYFSSENVKYLSKVGKGLILYGFGIFILCVILNFPLLELTSYSLGLTIGKSLTKSIPIFIFSSFVLLITSILAKGSSLKEEHDLTI